ncbi:hypothetical protein EDF53_3686, partial [Curtobacterium sp. PhB78]
MNLVSNMFRLLPTNGQSGVFSLIPDRLSGTTKWTR